MEDTPQALVERTAVKPKRRMRSNAEKRRMVEETLIEGVSVAAVARRHGVNTNLLFGWRRLYRQGLLERCREPGSAELLPVRVTPAGIGGEPAGPLSEAGEIEIDLPGEIRVRLKGPIDRHALAEVLAVLAPR